MDHHSQSTFIPTTKYHLSRLFRNRMKPFLGAINTFPSQGFEIPTCKASSALEDSTIVPRPFLPDIRLELLVITASRVLELGVISPIRGHGCTLRCVQPTPTTWPDKDMVHKSHQRILLCALSFQQSSIDKRSSMVPIGTLPRRSIIPNPTQSNDKTMLTKSGCVSSGEESSART